MLTSVILSMPLLLIQGATIPCDLSFTFAIPVFHCLTLSIYYFCFKHNSLDM